MPSSSGKTVIVVEGRAGSPAALCDIMKLDGYNVRTVVTCDEAFSQPVNGDLVAFVLDSHLTPGVANDTVARLREAWPHAAIIVVTEPAHADNMIQNIGEGADDFLFTPIHPATLRFRLSRVIDLRQSHQRLRETYDRLRAVLNTAVDPIVTINSRGMIVDFNPAALRMFGYSESELVGQNVKMLMPSPYQDEHDQYLANYLATGQAKIIGIGREVIARRKDGSTFPIDLAVSEFRDGGGPMFTGIIRDITDRKEIERHLIETRLDEQQRISYELHDGVGGLMTGIALLAKTTHIALDRARSPHAQLAKELVEHIGNAHEQLRHVAHGLAPIDVTPESLSDGLREMAARFSTGSVTCQFICDGPIAIHDSTTATQLYMIAQEAVGNAARHGKPSQITIRLTSDQGRGGLTILDDGTGYQQNPDGKAGLGLRTMQYRATLIGATVIVRSVKGKGTLVTCQFPNHQPGDETHGKRG